jgi:hypothetical protein
MIPLSLLVYALFANLLLPLLRRLMFAGEAVGMAGRVGSDTFAQAESCRSARRPTFSVELDIFFPPPFLPACCFSPLRIPAFFYSATELGGPVFGVACTAHPSVPFRVDGPVVCQRLLDRRRWRRGAGPNRRDHPSPVQQEYIRTNCGGEFISSSLTAVSVTELCGY